MHVGRGDRVGLRQVQGDFRHICYNGNITCGGGYVGITEGPYAFQHGEIGIVMQIVGIVVCLGTGMVTAAVLSPILKATVGLRVPDDDQAEGLDVVHWDGIPPDVSSDAESA